MTCSGRHHGEESIVAGGDTGSDDSSSGISEHGDVRGPNRFSKYVCLSLLYCVTTLRVSRVLI